MAKYFVEDSSLTAVADAIRAKGGTTEALAFPAGFIAAVESISAGGGGLQYDMGEFVLDADLIAPSFAHSLGVLPDFVFVWSEDFAGTTNEYGNSTTLGFVAINNPFGMMQRLSASANDVGIGVHFTQANGAEVITVSVPNTGSYNPARIFNSGNSTGENVKIIKANNLSYYRAGKTYKYFVCSAWWNVGGASNAE